MPTPNTRNDLAAMLEILDIPDDCKQKILNAQMRPRGDSSAAAVAREGKAIAASVTAEDIDRWADDARDTMQRFEHVNLQADARGAMAVVWHRSGSPAKARADLDLYDAAVAERDRLRARLDNLREYGKALWREIPWEDEL